MKDEEEITATFYDWMPKANKHGQMGTVLFFKTDDGEKIAVYMNNRPNFKPFHERCKLEKDGEYWRYRDNISQEEFNGSFRAFQAATL